MICRFEGVLAADVERPMHGILAPSGNDAAGAGTPVPDERQVADAAVFAQELLGFAADAKQTEVLRSGAKRLLPNCSRQWGKSTVTAAAAVHRAYCFPNSLILAVSATERQAGEFVRKARDFVARLGVRLKGDGQNKNSIALLNGSRIIGLPDVEETVRCFSAVNLLVIDEAAVVDEEAYHTLRPMVAVSGGGVWILSTPRGKSGFFWDLWDKGGPQWTRISATAEECSRIPAEFLAEEREALGDVRFRREYCCEFVQPEDSVFREEDVHACLTDDAPMVMPL